MRFRDWIMKRNPIFGSHLQRIGLLRIVPAALAMYAVIPVHIFIHLICIRLLYNLVICPLLKIERIDLRQYIIFDRLIISGLSWTGRFHCVYCEYANGLCVASGVLLTRVATEARPVTSGVLRPVVLFLYLVTSSLSALSMSLIVLLYHFIIAPSLGLHRESLQSAYDKMDAADFGRRFKQFSSMGYTFLRYENSTALLLANALEQVESQWCPIKHLDTRDDIVLPPHHGSFIERCELCKLRKVLCSEGSVSPRKPDF